VVLQSERDLVAEIVATHRHGSLHEGLRRH